jgi:Uncharacterized conserved protein
MNKAEIIELLEKEHLAYEAVEHPAIFTIDEMLSIHLPHPETVAKNLFLRDDKKRKYYLLTVREEKHIDLRQFSEDHGTRRLSFASEDDLLRILGLHQGSVTPLGLLNDTSHQVKFFLDADFQGKQIGIHPNENTATVWMQADDLIRLLKDQGCETEYAVI